VRLGDPVGRFLKLPPYLFAELSLPPLFLEVELGRAFGIVDMTKPEAVPVSVSVDLARRFFAVTSQHCTPSPFVPSLCCSFHTDFGGGTRENQNPEP
jgi:hypothetical protein